MFKFPPCHQHTLRISSVPNNVRNMLESIALTEPIDLCPPIAVIETTGLAVARDRGRAKRKNIDIVLDGRSVNENDNFRNLLDWTF